MRYVLESFDLPLRRRALPLVENALHLRRIVDAAKLAHAARIQSVAQRAQDGARSNQHRADLDAAARRSDRMRDLVIDRPPLSRRKRHRNGFPFYRDGAGIVRARGGHVATQPKLLEVGLKISAKIDRLDPDDIVFLEGP